MGLEFAAGRVAPESMHPARGTGSSVKNHHRTDAPVEDGMDAGTGI
jgi:hypothetical protein